MPHILMFGLLIGGQIYPIPQISGTYFETRELCEQTRNHPAIVSSYASEFDAQDLRIWCEPILQKPSPVRRHATHTSASGPTTP